MLKLIYIATGSALGGVLRYLLSRVVQEQTDGLFPWGTFAVNIIGCFAIGLIYALIDRGYNISPEMRLFLTVGFCGGFTTFSTFAHENYLLFQSDHFPTVALYAALSLLFGFTAAWAGHLVPRLL